jgi:hypothetical protein
MAPSRSDAPSARDRIRVSWPGFGPENTLVSLLARTGPCVPLRRGAGWQRPLTCPFVAQAMTMAAVASIRERDTDIYLNYDRRLGEHLSIFPGGAKNFTGLPELSGPE